jgi:exodeoxyribonuclease VII large subunit
VPDLFASPNRLPLRSVSDLASEIRAVLETDFDQVHVEGELSNFRAYPSGHLYFSLKDDAAQIRGVMWKGAARGVFFTPEDGMQVRIRGRVSHYAARGDTQLVADTMEPAGEGALRAAFERLKGQLASEGLLDASRKRPLPAYPERIGVVTSAQSAAVRDVLAVLERRFPLAQVFVLGVRVQGSGAAAEIAEAVRTFATLPPDHDYRPDVLIVGRGGGSAEDLWAFNEEPVARAIADCPIPVVSAVGHETDFSIADFVADVRAATPSMAAELAVPHAAETRALLHGLATTIGEAARVRIDGGRLSVARLTGSAAWHRTPQRVREARTQTERRIEQMTASLQRRLDALRSRSQLAAAQVSALDPVAPLRRGYARVETADGVPVTSAEAARRQRTLRLRFADSDVTALPADDRLQARD